MTNVEDEEMHKWSLEQLLENIEANLVIYGTTIKGGVETFNLEPYLEQALKDTRMALGQIRDIEPVKVR